ncbi:MAG: hypothetical protein AB201_00585 [Parcubacteria bacterium C7867-006]|nr:MAG: hypothetical protein AB201_00585 [Parcubacteria bacterium C7867-006]
MVETWGLLMIPDQFARHIRVRAYYLSLERQRLGLPSNPVADWCQAEAEFGLAPNRVSELVSRFLSYLKSSVVSAQVLYDSLSVLFRIPVSFQPLAM